MLTMESMALGVFAPQRRTAQKNLPPFQFACGNLELTWRFPE
jgi:hypothetical protein